MSEVKFPEGWIVSNIGKVALNTNNLRKPISLQQRATIKGSYPYYGATGQIDSLNDFTHEGEHILIGEDGANLISKSKNLAFIVDGKYWVNNHAHSLKSLADMPSSYLCYYFNSLNLTQWITGSAQPKLNKANLEAIPFPLPPLAEQKVIADKLDTLLAQVETTKARLDRIPQILKTFRQSVLAAAVSGKLTEEWRESNELPSPKEVKLEQIVCEGPQNGLYKAQSFYGGGIRIIRIDGFYDGEIVDWDKIKRLSLEDSEYSRWKLEIGDILVNRVNSIEYLGKSAIVRELPEPAVFESNIMKFRVNPDEATPEYIVKFLCSTTGLSQLKQNAKLAVNQASINQQDVKNCSVYLPVLEEQTEIVLRVEELFAFADSIEQKANAALDRFNNLTQSILAKAFRGELSTQWRKDNPDLITGENSAEALLAKIKAEREAKSPKKNVKTKKAKA
jgi:type I restriction enzyme S subunit